MRQIVRARHGEGAVDADEGPAPCFDDVRTQADARPGGDAPPEWRSRPAGRSPRSGYQPSTRVLPPEPGRGSLRGRGRASFGASARGGRHK